jgi:hypothetical protein
VHTRTDIRTAQRSAAQHGAAQRSTAQHSASQHSTAHHSAAQRSTSQHSTAQHSTAHHSTAPYNAQISLFRDVGRSMRVGAVAAHAHEARGLSTAMCACSEVCMCANHVCPNRAIGSTSTCIELQARVRCGRGCVCAWSRIVPHSLARVMWYNVHVTMRGTRSRTALHGARRVPAHTHARAGHVCASSPVFTIVCPSVDRSNIQ